MSTEIKYEKINSQNIQVWLKTDLLYKPDLQQEKGNIKNILALSDTILQKFIDYTAAAASIEAIKEVFQARLDWINVILDLYNDSTTEECLDFIDIP